ncbi:MAG: hypothetical protein M3Z05_22985, partial [Gemmatimonadota bacterium]|nr:hypothetical protein [Gemmatimonadota bacterium]
PVISTEPRPHLDESHEPARLLTLLATRDDVQIAVPAAKAPVYYRPTLGPEPSLRDRLASDSQTLPMRRHDPIVSVRQRTGRISSARHTSNRFVQNDVQNDVQNHAGGMMPLHSFTAR